MPNWCYNYLTVEGERTELDRFVEAVTLNDGGYDLSLIFPTPQELAETPALFGVETEKQQDNLAKYGYKDWYDWNCANWGTKWSPFVEDFEYETDSPFIRVEARFDTAWCPSTGLMKEISRQFPTLVFEVTSDEESQAFVCCEIFSAGEMVSVSFDPFAFDELPEVIADRMREAHDRWEKECEAGSDSDDYNGAWLDWLDACQELREIAISEAGVLFGRKTVQEQTEVTA
jgi:hypothetical protein